ncbi:response regulator [Novosphingobium sp. M1R2S20]|uniref:Response regulator n=1 Tax=Novosphingobium rhizovicinum TaxID=3228928 RepID=A0ABV3REL9_9SPHN
MCHALIIEDEAVIAFHIGDLVEQAGAKSISYAQTELEAVSAAMDRKPDIIVSDVKLLTGNGPDAVTSIRRRLGRVPTIFITGNAEALHGYDYDGLMDKPFEEDRFRATIARFVINC